MSQYNLNLYSAKSEISFPNVCRFSPEANYCGIAELSNDGKYVTFFYFLTIFQFLSAGRMWRPVCTESEWRAALRKAYFQCCVFSPTYVYVQTRAAEQGAIASPPQYF